jgi:hypothetical protein
MSINSNYNNKELISNKSSKQIVLNIDINENINKRKRSFSFEPNELGMNKYFNFHNKFNMILNEYIILYFPKIIIII